jgi:uncharacterized membrane protein
MAATASRQKARRSGSAKAARSGPAKAARSGPAKGSRSGPAKAAKTARRKTATAVVKHAPGGRRLAVKAARRGLKRVGTRALRSGAEALRAAVSRSAEMSRTALDAGATKRAPIQVSVDVAVPLEIAWGEWMSFSAFTEGVHHIEQIERDGDSLIGRTAGPHPLEWVADIVDERPQQSFAWRTVEGTDCAGLVTFHRLSDRLTRIELDLDVLPTRPADALSLALHIADRRAETDLRRFKADVEFINPDVYEDQLEQNGTGPKQNGKGPNQQRKRQRAD